MSGAPAADLGGVVVLGLGNDLRGDDGVGLAVTDVLAPLLRPRGASVVQAHQVLPEHAEAIASARLLVTVDAALHRPPGSVALGPFVAGRTRRRARGAGAAPFGSRRRFAHGLDLPGLLELVHELYATAPRTVVVGVGVGAGGLEAGVGLSGPVAAAVPVAVRAVLQAIDQAPERAVGAGAAQGA